MVRVHAGRRVPPMYQSLRWCDVFILQVADCGNMGEVVIGSENGCTVDDGIPGDEDVHRSGCAEEPRIPQRALNVENQRFARGAFQWKSEGENFTILSMLGGCACTVAELEYLRRAGDNEVGWRALDLVEPVGDGGVARAQPRPHRIVDQVVGHRGC